MGRKIWNRRLPQSYIDFSHALCAAENGNYFLRVAAAAYARPERRDNCGRYATLSLRSMSPAMLLMIGVFGKFSIVIATMSSNNGPRCGVSQYRLFKEGQTLSAADLAAMDKSDRFGDIAGVGPGRNWAHVNSIDYDPTDDSIILSVRNQSAVVKKSAETIKSNGFWHLPKVGAVRGKIRSLSLSMPLDKYSKLKVRPVKAASTGPGRSIRLSASTKNQPRM